MAEGGNGILTPPQDGDEIAPVIPLRQRQPDSAPQQAVRRSLPAERAPFDPELEQADVRLTRRRARRLRGWISVASRVRIPARPPQRVVVLFGCTVLAVLVVAGAVLAIDEPWHAARRTPAVEAQAGTKGASSPAKQHRSAGQTIHRPAYGRRPVGRRLAKRHTVRVAVGTTKRSSSTVESVYQPRQSANSG